jgi:hypothetical protein
VVIDAFEPVMTDTQAVDDDFSFLDIFQWSDYSDNKEIFTCTALFPND